MHPVTGTLVGTSSDHGTCTHRLTALMVKTTVWAGMKIVQLTLYVTAKMRFSCFISALQLCPSHSKFCLVEFTGHGSSGIHFHNYLFNFLIIKGIIPGWQKANLLTPRGQCSTQTPTSARDSFVFFCITSARRRDAARAVKRDHS